MRIATRLSVLLTIGLAAITVTPAPAVGQTAGELTVEELVSRALADNPDLKAARIEIEAATGSGPL